MTEDTDSNAIDRRVFLKSATAGGIGAMLSARSAPLLAMGGSPAEKVVVAVMGLNGRGQVHAKSLARTANVELAYVCDVDSTVLAKCLGSLNGGPGKLPRGLADFRRALEDKGVDALTIAAPDHWHTPAAIMAMQAGKHVYVEKPCGHNAREGELIVEAQKKYNKVVQMGSQQRSHPRSREVIEAIHGGAIGTPYQGRAWYANTRTGIGAGKATPVPANLDYELWQGPAPRTPYRDNVIHYNWHWFHRWGTGEINNNGTHEIDIARWALQVDFPTAVSSSGGRFHYQDDWEFPDTQEAIFEFTGNKQIIWQGASCNGALTEGRGRGTIILGTTGSVLMDRNGYTIYDLRHKVVKDSQDSTKTDGMNLSADDQATDSHLLNFVNAIRTGEALHAPIAEGAKSGLLCHLGNIAQETGRKLRTNPANGHIVGDVEATKRWGREYAPGWMTSV